MGTQKYTFLLTLLSLFVIANSSRLQAQEKHDGEISRTYLSNQDSITSDQSAVKDYIGFYQSYISRAKGSGCAMYPSCSNYGLMVFNQRPFFEAMALTADRLIRCSHDRKYYDETYEYGKSSLLDFPPYMKNLDSLVYKSKEYFYTDNLKSFDKKDSTTLFINHLINNNDYIGALSEINRTLFYDKTAGPDIYAKKLICYDALNREEDGVYDYTMNFPDCIQSNPSVIIKAVRLYMDMNNNKEAMDLLNRITEITPDSSLLYKKYVLEGMIHIRTNAFNEAKSSFSKSAQYTDTPSIPTTNLEIIKQLSDIKMKKPAVARFLSIIPGAGYIYTKQTQNAVTSLIINSLLAYATYTSIKSENYGVAGLMGVFSLSFYFGNFIGAGNSAKKYNQYQIKQQANRLMYYNQINNF